jgi:hypothetical protein
MTTTNGLVAAAYGSIARRKFSARDAGPGARSAPQIAAGGGRPAPRRARDPSLRVGRRLARARRPSAGDRLSRDLVRAVLSSRGAGVLLEAGRPVRIGGRGLDLLVALVERAGELVTKQDLIARVWPNVSVGEDDNLKTQIVFEPRWGTVATAPTTW